MSTSPAATAGAHHAEQSKFHIFVQIAMVLAVITGVEIIIVYLPFMKWLTVSMLTVLSAVKFLFVIFVFMHLKWDKVFCTILYLIGLVLALGTAAALIALFASEASAPLTALLMSPSTGAAG